MLGRRGLEELRTEAGPLVPQLGLASQGTARARGSWLPGQVDPLDLPTNGGTTTLGRGDPRGEPPWEGASFTESPGSKLCHWAGGCFLNWKEQEKHGVLGSLPNPEFALRPERRRGEAHGIWKTQCLPCCLPPEAAAAPPSLLPFLLPSSFGAFGGHDWVPLVSAWPPAVGPGSPQSTLGVTARMETHRDGR